MFFNKNFKFINTRLLLFFGRISFRFRGSRENSKLINFDWLSFQKCAFDCDVSPRLVTLFHDSSSCSFARLEQSNFGLHKSPCSIIFEKSFWFRSFLNFRTLTANMAEKANDFNQLDDLDQLLNSKLFYKILFSLFFARVL